MRYWLLKTEPSDYSFDDLENEPSGTVWDGVKNYAALKFLRDMEEGDRALVYHTGGQRRVVGIARVTSDAYPDPEEDDAKIQVVDVEADRRLERPVPLAELKADPAFDGHPLVKQPRLSVMELLPDQWQRVLELGQSAR
ncbi:MAG: EVE domain-containing protein [Acidobacteriota bacterium]|jgi:predicted RNA-binding protein with PUA-like domain